MMMARLVEKKLKWKNIDRTVNIRPATDRSKRSVYVRFKSVLSEKAWLNEKKGEAIEAVMFSPFIPLVKDIVFFVPSYASLGCFSGVQLGQANGFHT